MEKLSLEGVEPGMLVYVIAYNCQVDWYNIFYKAECNTPLPSPAAEDTTF